MSSFSKGEQTRAAIVKAAMREAAVSGVNALSIGGLASSTGMSKSGLFGHFGSKEALQMSVLEAVIDKFTDRVIVPALKTKDGIARLETLFDLFISWMEKREAEAGCPVMALSLELTGQPGPLRDFIATKQQEWMDMLARMAAKCVASGQFRADLDIGQFAFEFEGIAFSYNFSRFLLRDSRSEEVARGAFIRLMADAKVNPDQAEPPAKTLSRYIHQTD